jgi:hypothetical protein
VTCNLDDRYVTVSIAHCSSGMAPRSVRPGYWEALIAVLAGHLALSQLVDEREHTGLERLGADQFQRHMARVAVQ